MKLDLLEHIFTDTETVYTQEEAVQIAKLFYNSCMRYCEYAEIQERMEDYWIQIGIGWDLNIYDGEVFSDDELFHAVLHAVTDGQTDTEPTVDITEELYKGDK